MANPTDETSEIPPSRWSRILVIFLCFLPGILYMGVAARRSRTDITSRLYWEYSGRILHRSFVDGYPEALQHELARIYELPIGKAKVGERPLAPYTDFPCEYPPAALLIFTAIRLPFDEFSWFMPAFQVAMGLCCVMAAILVLLAVRRYDDSFRTMVGCGVGFSVWVLLEGGLTVNQFDPATMLTMALALFFFSRACPHWAAAALGIGGAIKLWPLLIVPALALACTGDRPLLNRLVRVCTIGAAGFVAFVLTHVPMVMAGTAFGDLFQYAAYMKDRPLEPSSVSGNLAILWQMIAGETPQTKWAFGGIGAVGPKADAIKRLSQLVFPVLYAAVLAWMLVKRSDFKRFANFSALILCVTLLTSKVYIANYLIWLLPFFLVDLAFRRRMTVLFYLGSILAWKIVFWSRQDMLSVTYTMLLLFKNVLLLGLTLSYARALATSEPSSVDSDSPPLEPARPQASVIPG